MLLLLFYHTELFFKEMIIIYCKEFVLMKHNLDLVFIT